MSKEIQALKELVEKMERTYEQALQTEGELQIAYREGIMIGLYRAIKELESLEE